jgi:hypothetical protein
LLPFAGADYDSLTVLSTGQAGIRADSREMESRIPQCSRYGVGRILTYPDTLKYGFATDAPAHRLQRNAQLTEADDETETDSVQAHIQPDFYLIRREQF